MGYTVRSANNTPMVFHIVRGRWLFLAGSTKDSTQTTANQLTRYTNKIRKVHFLYNYVPAFDRLLIRHCFLLERKVRVPC